MILLKSLSCVPSVKIPRQCWYVLIVVMRTNSQLNVRCLLISQLNFIDVTMSLSVGY